VVILGNPFNFLGRGISKFKRRNEQVKKRGESKLFESSGGEEVIP